MSWAACAGRAAAPGTASRPTNRSSSDLIEEVYEAVEALDAGDLDAFAEELGDVLLQVVFHAPTGRLRRTSSRWAMWSEQS